MFASTRLQLARFAKISWLFSFLLAANSAFALPWDFDMYRQESLQSNEVARAPVKGTVPLGRRPFTLTLEEAEKGLSNPVPFSLYSALARTAAVERKLHSLSWADWSRGWKSGEALCWCPQFADRFVQAAKRWPSVCSNRARAGNYAEVWL